MNQDLIESRRRWWLAGLLSFLVPGMGQVYNGEATKGLFYYFLISTWGGLVFSLLYYMMKHPITRSGLGVLFLLFFISIAAHLLVIMESIRTASKTNSEHRLNPYNRWYVYLIVIVLVSAVDQSVSFAIRDNVIKAYKIPSKSMQPTIEAGDHVFCNMLYYRHANPARNDLIIFKYPNDKNMEFIKRIIGLPGDTVEIINNVLFVNSRKVDEPNAVYTWSDNPSWQEMVNFGPVTVPENEYFVMGDNRNNSNDSRNFGAISRQEIQGKAVFIYFSWERDIPSWNIPARLASIRFSRIGEIL